MERFVKGDIVVIPFPFADIPHYKKRPSLIIAETEGSHVILCQITSRKKQDKYSISIDNDALESGTLKHKSNIRPNRIFTGDRSMILYKIGKLNANKLQIVIDKIVGLLKNDI